MFLHSWLVMWILAQNQFLGANCSLFLHSLAFNVEFGSKSISRSELIKVRCSCIRKLVIVNLVQNQFF